MRKRALWITLGSFAIMTLLIAYGLIYDAVSAGEMKYGLIYDWAFFTFLFAFLYFTRKRFRQSLFSYTFLQSAMLIHIAGAVFFYGLSIGVIQFDMFMHFYAGLALFFFAKRMMYSSTPAESLPMYGFAAVLAALGLAGVHELIEFFSYHFAGSGPGLFTSGGDMVTDYVDVNSDLLFGFVGALLGMVSNLLGRD